MDVLEYVSVFCPYCGEKNELTAERNETEASYTEDCQVCCRAMQIDVRAFGDEIAVVSRREDD